MIVYHGTTLRRANRIRMEGFRSKTKTHRTWFAKQKAIALARARLKARHAQDSPVVLTCHLDIEALRQALGPRSVRVSNNVVTVDGPVPPSVLQSPSTIFVPNRHEDLRVWLNGLLGLAPHEGVGRTDPGLDRLARWLDQRIASNPTGGLKKEELLEVGAQCLPALFRKGEPDFARVLPEAGTPASRGPRRGGRGRSTGRKLKRLDR